MGRRPAGRDEDLPLFAELNADREVTEHLLGPLTRSPATHITEHFLREGFGFWAVEVPGVAGFIGMAGIGILSYTAPFTPCVEVGWRLGRRYWGQGFATEAARAVLEFRLRNRRPTRNRGIDRAKQRTSSCCDGQARDDAAASDDFDHPLVPDGHELKRHVSIAFPDRHG